jgi:hypothetical protein
LGDRDACAATKSAGDGEPYLKSLSGT